jgi:hypothetical protein
VKKVNCEAREATLGCCETRESTLGYRVRTYLEIVPLFDRKRGLGEI